MSIKSVTKRFTEMAQRHTEKNKRNLLDSQFELTPTPALPLRGRGSQVNPFSFWGRVREEVSA